MTGLSQLESFLQSTFPLKERELQEFLSIWQPFECKRKTLLTAAGETEKYLYFVIDGVQRAFYSGEGKQDATIVFTYAPSFSGVADSFLTQTPSLFFLETLTQSSFLRTTHAQMRALMTEYPSIQGSVLNLVSFILKGVLQRQAELQCFTAEQRFRALLKRSPHLLQLISHKYLASYLGIDPATFSKLMGTVRI